MGDLHGALLESGFSDDDIKFPEYASEVFVLNLRIPVLPRAIVEPRTSQLVSASVRVANEFDLKVQARSGGHSYANYSMGGSDGHLIVDLKHFKEFQMDTTTWRANVGPAVSLKDLCQLLHDHGGRAIPHGTCPAVGIGG
jgi:FAD/FMN-containing dehydrogenase